MIKVALTGNFGSGKSFVANILKELGACVYDADAIIHHLYENDEVLKKEVVKLLTEQVLTENKLDRKKIANIVFRDKQKLYALENIVHKALYDYVDNLIKSLKECEIFVLEASLVIEKKTYTNYDYVIVVYTDEKISKKRLLEKGYDEDEISRRLSFQMPITEKIKYADFVIDNSNTREDTITQTKYIFEKIKYGKI